MTERGKYIVLEGPDGVGKSTQLPLTGKILQNMGISYINVKEPGNPDSEACTKIREILLQSKEDLHPLTELALFSADRSHLWRGTIQPALEAGTSVLSDRNYQSSFNYQGYGGGIPLEDIEQITRFFTDDSYMNPDLTMVLLFDSVEQGLERAQDRGQLDRMEQKGLVYHRRVLGGYNKRSKHVGSVAINASQSIEQVSGDIKKALEGLYGHTN